MEEDLNESDFKIMKLTDDIYEKVSGSTFFVFYENNEEVKIDLDNPVYGNLMAGKETD